jgi:hypothetical protein
MKAPLLAAIAICCCFAGCGGDSPELTARPAAAHKVDGFPTGTIEKEVNIWKDSGGYYTCPPQAPIESANPPGCAISDNDRVRLEGSVLTKLDGAEVRDRDYVATATIEGQVTEDGYLITVSRLSS